MRLLISAGKGPRECSMAVSLFVKALLKEVPKATMVTSTPDGEYLSAVTLELPSVPLDLAQGGTILWACQSPLRPKHKRKNWFIHIQPINDSLHTHDNSICDAVCERDIVYTYFHCGGKGGQNVNKVQTGVRATHIPTGIVVTATEERTQLLNKRGAYLKIAEKLESMGREAHALCEKEHWQVHQDIERGNPIRTYRGLKFKRY